MLRTAPPPASIVVQVFDWTCSIPSATSDGAKVRILRTASSATPQTVIELLDLPLIHRQTSVAEVEGDAQHQDHRAEYVLYVANGDGSANVALGSLLSHIPLCEQPSVRFPFCFALKIQLRVDGAYVDERQPLNHKVAELEGTDFRRGDTDGHDVNEQRSAGRRAEDEESLTGSGRFHADGTQRRVSPDSQPLSASPNLNVVGSLAQFASISSAPSPTLERRQRKAQREEERRRREQIEQKRQAALAQRELRLKVEHEQSVAHAQQRQVAFERQVEQDRRAVATRELQKHEIDRQQRDTALTHANVSQARLNQCRSELHDRIEQTRAVLQTSVSINHEPTGGGKSSDATSRTQSAASTLSATATSSHVESRSVLRNFEVQLERERREIEAAQARELSDKQSSTVEAYHAQLLESVRQFQRDAKVALRRARHAGVAKERGGSAAVSSSSSFQYNLQSPHP